ncbi:MAG: glycerophosphodiester phosphodiesterase [Lentisphaerae bacterium]|nr:glycerophosphodiester phosphodiesterase [Lentisphaerota bacterium]
MLWISHRGESWDAPENTLPAFRLSRERRTDGMECDVHLTADGKLVVCHDSDTQRTCSRSMVIEESCYADLQNLTANNNKAGFEEVKIPLFAETLQYLGQERVYYVEIKNNDPAVIDALIAELDQAAVPPEQVVMISFHANIVKLFKARYPERKALFLTSFKVSQQGTWTPTADELIKQLQELGADGVDIHCNLNFIVPEYVNKVKAAGFAFAVWTVDDEAAARRFAAMGVDAITSNRAAALQMSLDKK